VEYAKRKKNKGDKIMSYLILFLTTYIIACSIFSYYNDKLYSRKEKPGNETNWKTIPAKKWEDIVKE